VCPTLPATPRLQAEFRRTETALAAMEADVQSLQVREALEPAVEPLLLVEPRSVLGLRGSYATLFGA